MPLSRPSLPPRKIILLLLGLLALAALGWLLRDVAREWVIQPLSDLAWLGWVALSSLPQAVIWGAFLLLTLFLALRSLSGGSPSPAAPQAARAEYFGTSSRVHFWRASINSLPTSPFAAERLARDLQAVVVQILAEETRANPAEVRERLLHDTFEPPVPPAIAALFRPIPRTASPTTALRWWARLTRRPELATLPAPFDVAAVVKWIEDR